MFVISQNSFSVLKTKEKGAKKDFPLTEIKAIEYHEVKDLIYIAGYGSPLILILKLGTLKFDSMNN